LLDTLALVAYFLVVGIVAVVASRRERVAADYFLAGRQLPWWLIGTILIAIPFKSANSDAGSAELAKRR
jgi:SSS family solute:Na+ symporter